jgi:hypothetical protein
VIRLARSTLLLAVSAGLLAGCGYTGSQGSQIRQWASANTYATNEQQVVADAHSLLDAVARGSALQLRTICGGISSDAGTLYTTLPAPNHRLTDELNAAMQDFFAAGQGCAVTSSTHSSAAHRAVVATDEGLHELSVVNEGLRRFGVSS